NSQKARFSFRSSFLFSPFLKFHLLQLQQPLLLLFPCSTIFCYSVSRFNMTVADANRIITTVRKTQMLPPRRGRVKIRIFKSLVALLSCSGGRKKPKDGGEGSYYYHYSFPANDSPLKP
ncbi:hypothetical protein PIB30_006879, partial [Stylosanthes scabra]|nr:hypothetical protein [Stylosanthes scabra]